MQAVSFHFQPSPSLPSWAGFEPHTDMPTSIGEQILLWRPGRDRNRRREKDKGVGGRILCAPEPKNSVYKSE